MRQRTNQRRYAVANKHHTKNVSHHVIREIKLKLKQDIIHTY